MYFRVYEVLHHWAIIVIEIQNHVNTKRSKLFLGNLKRSYFSKTPTMMIKTARTFGSRKQGEKLAKNLIEHNIDFTWVTVITPINWFWTLWKKMAPILESKQLQHPQIIITVANKEASRIYKWVFLLAKWKKPVQDYFFFCWHK